MTPHPSHAMGIVEGEPCCVICYAAPWMAIVEQSCETPDLHATTRANIISGHASRPHMTLAELEQVVAWRAAGRTWKWCAAEMDRTVGNLVKATRALRLGTGRLAREAERERGAVRATSIRAMWQGGEAR